MLLVQIVETPLTCSLSTFLANGQTIFNKGQKSLIRFPPECMLLDIFVFKIFTLVTELFGKTLQKFETCLYKLVTV